MYKFQAVDVIEAIQRQLARKGLSIRLETDFSDYVPPLILPGKVKELLISAAECLAECLGRNDTLRATAFYQDRRDATDCSVVLSLQQRCAGSEEPWVIYSWLERYGDIRDQLLSYSVGMTLQGSPHGFNAEFRLPVYSAKMQALQHRNTILLVEDNAFVRDASRDVLEAEGFVVETRATAEEAEGYLDHHSACVKLVITDLLLPGHNGQILAERLHQVARAVPVLITSGYGITVKEDLPQNTYFLAKPYNAQTLLAAVRRCLQAVHLPLAGTLLPQATSQFNESC